MKQLFKTLRSNFFLGAALSILLGLALIIFPVKTSFLFCYVAGGLLIVCGIINIIRYVMTRNDPFFQQYDLLIGIVLCLAGLFVITQSAFVVSFIPTIVGLVLLFNGIINLVKSMNLKTAGFDRWQMDLIFAVLTILLGLLIWFRPFDAVATTNIFIGVCLIFNGISNLVTLIGLGKIRRAIETEYPQEVIIDVEEDELH